MGEAYHRGGKGPEDHHHHKVNSPAQPLLGTLAIPSLPVLHAQKYKFVADTKLLAKTSVSLPYRTCWQLPGGVPPFLGVSSPCFIL